MAGELAASYTDQLATGLERLLIALGRRIADDPKIHATVNKWLRIAALRTIAPRRAETGAFITQVVERWDTETLVNRIELQVARSPVHSHQWHYRRRPRRPDDLHDSAADLAESCGTRPRRHYR